MRLLAEMKEFEITLKVDVVEGSAKEEEDVRLTLIIVEVERVTKKVVITVMNNSEEAKEAKIDSFPED